LNFFTLDSFILKFHKKKIKNTKGEGPTGKESKGAVKEGWLTKQGSFSYFLSLIFSLNSH